MNTTRGSSTTALSDDHIDLLITAAARWHILTPRTRAAFAQSTTETHVQVATATEAGRQLQEANRTAIACLVDQGRARLVDCVDGAAYVHTPVETLHPVEVIKAAHAAQNACKSSTTWVKSPTRRLLEAVVTSATHRLAGYADAPWAWTRPRRRGGTPIGVAAAGQTPPAVPGLDWVSPQQARDVWSAAALVLVTVGAAADVPADLPARAGVFVLAEQEDHNQVWEALTALEMEALVLFWPACEQWLVEQLQNPSAEFIEHRSTA